MEILCRKCLSRHLVLQQFRKLNVSTNTYLTQPSISLPDSSEDIESLGVICTSVTTIAATAVTLSLAHVLGLVGAFCCYKWHRKSKRKKILQKSLKMPIRGPAPNSVSTTMRQSAGRQEEVFYAKPDVSFRNVYGAYRPPPQGFVGGCFGMFFGGCDVSLICMFKYY